MNVTLNMNNGPAIFFEIKDHNTQSNLCKNYLKPANVKNYDGSFTTRKLFVRQELKKQPHQLKKENIGE